MTLEEAENSLPNGFHDAEIELITHDLLAYDLELQVFVWVGTMDDPPSQRERYRRGVLRFAGVEYFAQPIPRQLQQDLKILAFEKGPSSAEEPGLPLPSGVALYRFYTGYVEIDVAAASTSFDWIEPNEVNRHPN